MRFKIVCLIVHFQESSIYRLWKTTNLGKIYVQTSIEKCLRRKNNFLCKLIKASNILFQSWHSLKAFI